MDLAERLGCTLSELGQRMTASEYQLWKARSELTEADFAPDPEELTVDQHIAMMERVLN